MTTADVCEMLLQRDILVLTHEYVRKAISREDLVVKRITDSIVGSWVDDRRLLASFSRRFDCSRLLRSKLSMAIECSLLECLEG